MDGQPHLDEAFEAIEETILPSISIMLDTLLDAATLAQPGVDADVHASELRVLSVQLEALTRQVEAISNSYMSPEDYPAASAA
jgi:hypothetical protein